MSLSASTTRHRSAANIKLVDTNRLSPVAPLGRNTSIHTKCYRISHDRLVRWGPYAGTLFTLRRSLDPLSIGIFIGSWWWVTWWPWCCDSSFACFSCCCCFILSCSSRSLRACSFISFTARSSFFNFMRLFWNQILICLSVRQSAWAISILRRRVR